MFDGAAFGKEMVGIVRGYVERALSPLLLRIDALEGRSVGISQEAAAKMVADAVAKAVLELKPAPAAEPWQPDDEHLRSVLQPMVDALPRPENGKNITVEDVAPIIAEQVSTAVAALPQAKNGKDGRDGLDAVTPILKDGVLLWTMSDGTVKEVGRVSGEDGNDGQPGRDGIDGLGFDDMVAEYDGERGIVLRFVRGEHAKEFKFSLPVVLDRGVWIEGKEYATGDAVTWGGSLWIAQKDGATEKPDGGDSWRLAVKRGRDGKPGKDGELKAHQPVKVS